MDANVMHGIWQQEQRSRKYRFVNLVPRDHSKEYKVLVTELEFPIEDGMPTDVRGATAVESSDWFSTIDRAEDEAMLTYQRHIDQGWRDMASE